MKTIILWGAWYGSHNVGDQALLLSIIDILQELLEDVEFIVFTDNPDHVNKYTQRESNSRVTAYHNRRQFPYLVRSLAISDLFILGGGVPFYDEANHLLAMVILIGLAKLLKTPYMTWSVSSQVVQSNISRQLFKWMLDGAEVVAYRDRSTFNLFRSCGVEREMFLTVDPVYRLTPESDEIASQILRRAGWKPSTRQLVGLTPRTLLGRNRDAEKHYNVKTPEEFDRELICFASVVDWLWTHGYQPIFIPMNTIPPDDDRIAARRIVEMALHGRFALIVDEEIRPRQAPGVYRHCLCSFVARVHGSITSMVGNCPTMMYAFAPKHVGIMEMNGLPDFTLLEAHADSNHTTSMLSKLIDNNQQLRSIIASRLIDLKKAAMNPGTMAAKILDI